MSSEQMNKARRSAWIVVFITTMNVLVVVVYAWMQYTSISDGTYLAPGEDVWVKDGAIVTALDERADGLKTGDVVRSIDGRSLESWMKATLRCIPFVCNSKDRPHWKEGQEVIYAVSRIGERLELPIRLERHPVLKAIRINWSTLVFVTINVLIFGFVFSKRPYTPAVQVLLVSSSSLLGSMPWVIGLRVVDVVNGTGYWLHYLATEWVYLLTWFAILHFTLIFPTPHPIVKRFKWSIPALYTIGFASFAMITIVAYQVTDNVLLAKGRALQGQSGLVGVYLAFSLLALVTNYRNQRSAENRQQIRIIVFAAGVVLVIGILFWLLPQVIWDEAVFSSHTMAIIGLLFPIAIAVSILRYRLWDIDILINRTLVYFSLTAIVVSIYIVIVGSLGSVLQTTSSHFLSLVATGVVAISFQPLRGRLQRGTNRLMYGERDEPYTVLEHLAERLEVVVASESVLPIIVETVADALKLPYAAIALKEDDDFLIAAEYIRSVAAESRSAEDREIFALVYQSETIGQLILALRAPGEQFSHTDKQLLATIARQAGIAAYNVRLTQDLQRSRERLVTTREEERRRLRRDLHDGLGPTLASMSFRLDAVHNLAERDPDEVKKIVIELKAQMQAALMDIRRIAYNLRPPALDELGLVGALREHIATHNRNTDLQIFLDAPEDVAQLSAAAEVAVYRIALEAITNVVHHASAHQCIVRLRLDEQLRLEITDDGRGIAEDARTGVGMSSMRERARELGGECMITMQPDGGTSVTAQLPFERVGN